MGRIIKAAILALVALTLLGCTIKEPELTPADIEASKMADQAAAEYETTSAEPKTIEINGKTYPLPLQWVQESYQIPFGGSGALGRRYLNEDPNAVVANIPVDTDTFRQQREAFKGDEEPTYAFKCIFYYHDTTKCTNAKGAVVREADVAAVVTLVKNSRVVGNGEYDGPYRCNLVCVDKDGNVHGRVSDEMLLWRHQHCMNPEAGLYNCKWIIEKIRLE